MEHFKALKKGLPTRVSPPNDSVAKKPIPFEAVDLELYEPEALCTTIRIHQHHLEAWLFSLLKGTELLRNAGHMTAECIPMTEAKKTIDIISENIKSDIKNLGVIQLKYHGPKKEKLFTIHYWTTTGLVEIQGNYYKQWCLKYFPIYKNIADQYNSDQARNKNTSSFHKWHTSLQLPSDLQSAITSSDDLNSPLEDSYGSAFDGDLTVDSSTDVKVPHTSSPVNKDNIQSTDSMHQISP